MKKYQFSYKPDLVTSEGSGVLICFGVEEVEVVRESILGDGEETTSIMYDAYAVRLQHPITHSRVVDAIVSAAYPSDVMQAITNNHMLADGNEEHEAEYAAMQVWRNLAKATADEVLGYNIVSEKQYDHEPERLESLGNGDYIYRWGIKEEVIPIEEEIEEDHIEDNLEMVEPTQTEVGEESETLPEEPTEVVEPSEEVGEESEEPQTYSVWKCKEVMFVLPMTAEKLASIIATAEGVEKDSEDYAPLYNEVGLVVIPLDMESAKKELTEKILAYDSSESVNSFTFGGIPMWLDKATRVGLKLRFEAEIALGNETTTLWLNGMNFTLPLSGERSAMNVLVALEVYASASYDATQMHLANVAAMTTAEEIIDYDITSGYPDKLIF